VAILVSRYNELITRKLLDGALACCSEAGVSRDEIDVIWLPGAFELAAGAAAAAETGRYSCLVALGTVIRGETPHFDYVAGEAARGLNEVAVRHALPVGYRARGRCRRQQGSRGRGCGAPDRGCYRAASSGSC
jgi:6,7-dimethyl-8-ribityllumazine synthase